MTKKNGNGKSKFELILYRLDEQKESNTAFNLKFDCIIEKITGIRDKNACQDVAIEGVTKNAASTQSELTELKDNAKWFVGLGIAISSAFASVVGRIWK